MKLEKCSKCGHADVLWTNRGRAKAFYVYVCRKCGSSTSECETIPEAEKEWNKQNKKEEEQLVLYIECNHCKGTGFFINTTSGLKDECVASRGKGRVEKNIQENYPSQNFQHTERLRIQNNVDLKQIKEERYHIEKEIHQTVELIKTLQTSLERKNNKREVIIKQEEETFNKVYGLSTLHGTDKQSKRNKQ